MAKFEVRRKLDALSGGYVAIGNENHICYRTTRKESTAYKLADKIYAAMLICNRHDNAYGYKEECTDREGKEKSVPWEVDRVTGTD